MKCYSIQIHMNEFWNICAFPSFQSYDLLTLVDLKLIVPLNSFKSPRFKFEVIFHFSSTLAYS